MYIKRYDFYEFKYNGRYFIDFLFKDELYDITRLLKEIYPYDIALWYENFIKQPQSFSKIGIFQNIEVTLDEKNNIVYLSDASEDDYRFRTKNITTDMILQLCYEGTLEYNTITKDNFIYLVSSWVQLLENEPPFALLYQNDKDWYDVLSFETQEAMEQFVADHTKKEEIQK